MYTMTRCMNLYYDSPFGKQQEEDACPVPDVLRWTQQEQEEEEQGGGGLVPDATRWTIFPLRFSQELDEKTAPADFRGAISHSPTRRRRLSSSRTPMKKPTDEKDRRTTAGDHDCSRTKRATSNERRTTARRRSNTFNGTRDCSATRETRRRRSNSRASHRRHISSSSRRKSSGTQRKYTRQPPQPEDERKASIKMQTVIRRFLACMRFEKLLQKKDYEMYVMYKRDCKAAQEGAIQSVQERIQEKQREAEAEIRAMKETFENEKEVLREQMRRKMSDIKPQFDADVEFHNQESIRELEEEQKQLKVARNGLRDMNKEMRDENSTLEQANDEISKMFSSLNNFAQKKVEEKKKLAPVQQKLVKEHMPKARREFAQGLLACNVESIEKEIYRRHMYKIMNAVQITDMYDHELYEAVMDTVQSCESELGIETMDFNESFTFSEFGHTGEAGAGASMSASFLLLNSSSSSSLHFENVGAFETS